MTERVWSTDQKIKHRKDGSVVIEFTATSEPEVLNWVLNFGEEAKLLGPPELVAKLKERLEAVQRLYA